jgi:hypothetical protein
MTDNPAMMASEDGKPFHPAVAGVLRFFEFEHLPQGPIRETAQWYAHRAYWVASRFQPDPELTVALRKLLESKDAAVRCAVLEAKARRDGPNPAAPLVAKPMAPDREFRDGPC